jgi:GNAT superfamily N-acetyltransferase
LRAGSSEDVERCVELWTRVIVARDGCEVVPGVVRQRAQAAFTRPVIRFAVIGAEPKGFALTLTKAPRVALLSRLCVDANLNSRGLGTTLLKDAVEQARAGGFARIDLDVRQTNTRAIALYTRIGFAAIADPWKYDDGDPVIPLSLELTTVLQRGETGSELP